MVYRPKTPRPSVTHPRQWLRYVSCVGLLALCLSFLPAVQAQSSPTELIDLLPQPPTQSADPLPMTHTPVLAVSLVADQPTLQVGDRTTMTVTLANQTAFAAHSVVVTLPLPTGAVAVPDRAYQPSRQQWQWTLDELGGFATQTFTVQLRVPSARAGDALIAQVQVTTTDLATLATAQGGVVLVPRVTTPQGQTARFTPGQRATLARSSDHVRVTLSPHASDQPLTIRARTLAEHQSADPKQRTPRLAHGKRSFTAVTLDATTDSGTDVHTFSDAVTITLDYTPTN